MGDGWRFIGEMPDVPGLVFRGFRGEPDLPGMVRVINASTDADGIGEHETLEGLRTHYAHLDNSDPERDVIVAEIHGDIVGYGRVLWWDEHEGPRRYVPLCSLDPAVRNRGIGTAMYLHNEARLLQIAADHQGDRERSFMVFYPDAGVGAAAIYAAAGYEPFRYDADMIRPDLHDIPEAPMPDGLIVRTPRDDEMRKVWDADAEAFADHVGEPLPTDNDYSKFLEDPRRDPTLWRVAWDGDEVAGQVRSFINPEENEAHGRKRGYTEFISVRRPYRRRGLARSLLVQSLHALQERGMEEAALGVMTENRHGAHRLYESVGFHIAMMWTQAIKAIE